MRCPKCQYISFEDGDRCRNCGYEFSLAVESPELDPAALDLPIRTADEPSGPYADLVLSKLDSAAEPEAPPEPRRSRAERATVRHARAAAELPLFRAPKTDDDAPLVSLPATPRAPVSVRKSTLPSRPASTPTEEDLGREFAVLSQKVAARAQAATDESSEASAALVASSGARVGAALIDLTLILAIDAAVLYFTLKICGLAFDELRILPVVPFVSFLVILNGSYVTTFTAAGGQTLGKMIAGIRVVNADAGAWTDRVPLAQAVLRSASYLASAIPAGLGFLPAFIGADRRALHDRIAHTRVVKA